MSEQEMVTKKHIDALATELAKSAGITSAQAMKVLDILHISKLNENLVAMRDILKNEKSVNALGMSHAEASQRLQDLSADKLRLKDMRLGFKRSGGHIMTNPV